MRLRPRRLLLTCIALLSCGAFLTWYRLPTIYVRMLGGLENRDDEQCAQIATRLGQCGPRAIPADIDAIRIHSPWATGYLYLPDALQIIGEPAHQSLLRAIDSETNELRQAYLIYSLQAGFADFSRFDLWLAADAVHPKHEWELERMGWSVREQFRQAPPITKDRALNPLFVEWWKRWKNPAAMGSATKD